FPLICPPFPPQICIRASSQGRRLPYLLTCSLLFQMRTKARESSTLIDCRNDLGGGAPVSLKELGFLLPAVKAAVGSSEKTSQVPPPCSLPPSTAPPPPCRERAG
ncbi:hypothetical protein CHARACLAT_026611, partial [Characodon lateralis]|nr:hypothetical protein [Characodon lateralis]